MKDFGLALALGAVTMAPFALVSGLAVGGMFLYKKLKEKGSAHAGDFGDEGQWAFLDDTEVDYWDAFGC